MMANRALPDDFIVSTYSLCSGSVAVPKQQHAHADDSIHGRPDFMAHVCQELRFQRDLLLFCLEPIYVQSVGAMDRIHQWENEQPGLPADQSAQA